MQLDHIAVFGLDISIQTSPCLQSIQILGITSLELSGSLKNLEKSMRIRLNQVYGYRFVPYFDQAFIQFFPSFFVIEHFSLEKTSIRLVKASLRPKVLDDCYLRWSKVEINTHRYTAIGAYPGAHEHDDSTSLVYSTGNLLQLLLHIVRDVFRCCLSVVH